MSSAIQCNHVSTICQDLTNPDPRIRECKAAILGHATTPDLIVMELRAITSTIKEDCTRKQTRLGGYTLSLLEEAVIRLQETACYMSTGSLRDAIAALCSAALHLSRSWVERHGLTPERLDCPSAAKIAPSSPWKNPATYAPPLELSRDSRPRPEVKMKVLRELAQRFAPVVMLGGVQ